MRILVVYHFFYPDTVISARLMSELSLELIKRNHSVSVYTSNRLIRQKGKLCPYEKWNGINIKRFPRPGFSQKSNIGRLINSFLLQAEWIYSFLFERNDYDAVIVGTDPQFSWMMFPFIKIINRKVKLITWCFDLYPEALLVNGSCVVKMLASLTVPFAYICYHCCDVLVNIGECMGRRLKKYCKKAKQVTLTPWALVEPQAISKKDSAVRTELFGNAKIGLLYSGTVGYAHNIIPFIHLARECRKLNVDIAFCFAGYGNCYQEQISQITKDDTNIRLAGFTSEKDLEKRLSAADIHMISLRDGWEGIVLPSKFFGSLAIGRPVLFSGPQESSIYNWCTQNNIGLYLDNNTVNLLAQIANNKIDIEQLKYNSFKCYQNLFSKKIICDKWEQVIEL